MIQVRSGEAQQALHEMEVGWVHFSGDPQGAFALVGFLCEKVTAGGFPETDLSGTGYLEGLFRPGVGFYLWHDEKYYLFTLPAPLLRQGTYGAMWDNWDAKVIFFLKSTKH
jgi:hypothetical protein